MIRLEGIEEHPRYNNKSHILGKFNQFLIDSFYRYVIMLAIQESYKFRNARNIIENAISEALIMEDANPDEKELANLKELMIEFVSSKNYMDNYRGALFEQIIRFSGPKDTIINYHPQSNSLEEAKIFCEETSYSNGNCEKDVDIVFFENGLRINPNVYETERFIAYELKCNINRFVDSIIKAVKKGANLTSNSNYTKLLYLKDILIHFQDDSTVGICTLNKTKVYVNQFLKSIDLECIRIWEPLY